MLYTITYEIEAIRTTNCEDQKNPYSHIHPPYHKGNKGHNLVIMSYPDKIEQDEYNFFKHHLDHHVMENAFS